jgi:hypothetical protein
MVKSTIRGRTKFLSAMVGGCTVVALAGFSVAMGTSGASAPQLVAHPILEGKMTVGETITTTTPPTALAHEKAVPTLKAPPYGKG